MTLQDIIYEYLIETLDYADAILDVDWYKLSGNVANIVNVEQKKVDYWRDDVDQEDYPDLDDFYGKSEIEVIREDLGLKMKLKMKEIELKTSALMSVPKEFIKEI